MEKLRQLMDDEAAGRVTDHRALHSLLASLTHNPALELFVDALNRLAVFYFSDHRALAEPTLDASAHAHRRIAEAVISGNDGLASRRMAKHLRAEADYIRSRPGARQVLKPSAALKGPPGSKRAEQVARELFGEVLTGRLPSGYLLGSEPDLMDRYHVSRAVLREAVRILEHHHIAAMRRGPGGGLFVSPPSAAAVADVIASHLARHGTRADHLAELRVGVELAIVDLVIDRDDEEVEGQLRGDVAAATAPADDGPTNADDRLHLVLASLCGNRALELVARVLIRLADLPPARTRTGRQADAGAAHPAIVEAIIAGERQRAQQLMTIHLTSG